jgi:hypothetical protein
MGPANKQEWSNPAVAAMTNMPLDSNIRGAPSAPVLTQWHCLLQRSRPEESTRPQHAHPLALACSSRCLGDPAWTHHHVSTEVAAVGQGPKRASLLHRRNQPFHGSFVMWLGFLATGHGYTRGLPGRGLIFKD